jgi:hypothetical protein
MKLSKTTETVILGLLIVHIAFGVGTPLVRQVLSTSLGKAIFLAAIVYIGKTTSVLIAIVLALAYVKCSSGSIWEGFSGAEDTCLCEEEGFMWDGATKTCKNAEGLEGKVKSCTCMSGYSWDGGEKGTQQCVPTSGEQPPLPVPTNNLPVTAVDAVGPTVAPAVSTGPVTSTAPMTTPSAAQTMVTAAAPLPAVPAGGVQPTMGPTVSVPASM